MKLEPTALPTQKQKRLAEYIELLLRWNKSINLSGAKTRHDLELLAKDSLCLAAFMKALFPQPPEDFSIWDIGAGAGLPGIPLRIAWPKGQYFMIEPREKRALFLSNAIARLELNDVSVIQERAEHFFTRAIAPACILSRAFMPWQKLLEFCKPVLNQNALLIIMASEAPPALSGQWRLVDSGEYEIEARPRWLWALQHSGGSA